jgi:hypothetical protein
MRLTLNFSLESPLDNECAVRILIIVLNFIYTELRLHMVSSKSTQSGYSSQNETRCECGQLIAKVIGGGLELKCKRCKRIVIIPFSAIEGWSGIAS